MVSPCSQGPAGCRVPEQHWTARVKYILYASELQDLTGRYGVSMHGFADDTHLFVSDISSAKQDMLAAIADISQWSFTHKLKLNPDKSEVIWLGSRQQLAKLSEAYKSLQLPDGLVRSSTTLLRTLVLWLTSDLALMIRRVAVLSRVKPRL